jgi:hypothetical protein
LDTNDTPPLDIQGAITRARARQLNLEVSSFLSKTLYVNIENSILPNDYILLRNKGEDQEGDGEGLRDGGDQQRRRIKLEARARIRLGVQEQAALKRTLRSHTGSVWDVLHMHGKLRRRPIQWF